MAELSAALKALNKQAQLRSTLNLKRQERNQKEEAYKKRCVSWKFRQ
jgi:hypothetical protein